jgi:transcriptional regulator with XRE-family HTH domain
MRSQIQARATKLGLGWVSSMRLAQKNSLPPAQGRRERGCEVTLTEWRQSKDMSTRELATAIGERPSWVSDLEHGRITIHLHDVRLQRLAMVDGVMTESFFYQIIQEGIAKAQTEQEASKGPGYAFIETTEGCSLVQTMDGEPLPPRTPSKEA